MILLILMKRGEAIEKLFLAIDNIVQTGGNIFSRDSLFRKLDRLSGLNSVSRHRFNQTIKRSLHNKLIEIQEKDGKIFYKLTAVGYRKVNLSKLRELKISRDKWDGFWRVVVFDVPEEYRQGRDAIRKMLQHFGFYSLQKSVFVFPFKCETEIMALRHNLDITSYLEIFLTRSIGDKDKQLKSFFGL
jgi:DNA-binding transcriptional regulator PaaX